MKNQSVTKERWFLWSSCGQNYHHDEVGRYALNDPHKTRHEADTLPWENLTNTSKVQSTYSLSTLE